MRFWTPAWTNAVWGLNSEAGCSFRLTYLPRKFCRCHRLFVQAAWVTHAESLKVMPLCSSKSVMCISTPKSDRRWPAQPGPHTPARSLRFMTPGELLVSVISVKP